jgi:hypothetical protein
MIYESIKTDFYQGGFINTHLFNGSKRLVNPTYFKKSRDSGKQPIH